MSRDGAGRDTEKPGRAGGIHVEKDAQRDHFPLPLRQREVVAVTTVTSRDGALVPSLGDTWPGAGRESSGTSRRRLRQKDTRALSAVRMTQACGSGCLLTLPQAAQARANASATASSAAYRSPVLARTAFRHSSR